MSRQIYKTNTHVQQGVKFDFEAWKKLQDDFRVGGEGPDLGARAVPGPVPLAAVRQLEEELRPVAARRRAARPPLRAGGPRDGLRRRPRGQGAPQPHLR